LKQKEIHVEFLDASLTVGKEKLGLDKHEKSFAILRRIDLKRRE
jgi:hypothetical protein